MKISVTPRFSIEQFTCTRRASGSVSYPRDRIREIGERHLINVAFLIGIICPSTLDFGSGRLYFRYEYDLMYKEEGTFD